MFLPNCVRRVNLLACSLILVCLLSFNTPGDPSVSITAPEEGAVLLTSHVNITGSALGSPKDWTQTTFEDFSTGTTENLTMEPNGDMRLQTVIYDDFNDGELDASKWTKEEFGGVVVSETGGRLVIGGPGNSEGCWTARAGVSTLGMVSSRVSAELWSFSGAGTGYRAGFGFRDDTGNEILLELAFDIELYGLQPKTVLAYNVSGAACETALGDAATGVHTYSLVYEGGRVYAYRGSTQLGSYSITLNSPRCVFRSRVYMYGGVVGSVWDNVTCFFTKEGRYLSEVYDTGSPAPTLTKVAWLETVPAATQLSVRIRSSASADMSYPTPWTTVTNGQSSNLPEARRYIQYSFEMSSPQGLSSPIFKEIQLSYRANVLKVEVSTDSKQTWIPAEGTESWYVTIELPDGHHTIWARVTDYEGDIKDTAIELDVDTTRPTGSILIDLGAPITPQREVELQLRATDSYGVMKVMLSENSTFSGAQWQSYQSSVRWILSPGDGEKTVYAKFRDANGWESEVCSDSIILDETPPRGSVVINGGAEFTATTTVRLTLDAYDLSGISDVMLSNRQSLDDAEWIDYQPSMVWELRPGDGERRVYAVFRDAAGHTSGVESDSIILDTTPPSLSLTIDGGAEYTIDRAVTLELEASDNYGVADMMISTNPNFVGESWQPFRTPCTIELPSQEGLVRVYAKVRDLAGNAGQPVSEAIIYDGTPPSCVVSTLPPVTETESFTVRWNGADETSGVKYYDVQVRVGEGPWTDWLTGVNYTSAVFTGRHNETYSFRARAADVAGNVGAYPEVAKATTRVRLPWVDESPIKVSVSGPAPGATVRGKVVISGIALHKQAGKSVTLVQIRIDNGSWQDASGTENWAFTWDTTKEKNGPHTLRVRAFDGERYSELVELRIVVRNEPLSTASAGGGEMVIIIIVMVIIGAAVGAGSFLWLRKRRSGVPLVQPPSPPPAGAASPNPLEKEPARGAGPSPTTLSKGKVEGKEEKEEEKEALEEAERLEREYLASQDKKGAAPGALGEVAAEASSAPQTVVEGEKPLEEGAAMPPSPAQAIEEAVPSELSGGGEGPEMEEEETKPAGPRWIPEGETVAPPETETPSSTIPGTEVGVGAIEQEQTGGRIALELEPPVGMQPQADYDTVLRTINSMRPMLPLELQYLSPEELASMVVDGERGMSPQNEPLVAIMGKWYYADESRPEFLQRYKW
ncbi:MAG: Ig-like domain-containing protein [Thermoplasmata archaeon]